MKTIALSLLFFSVTSFSAEMGSKCGLTDTYSNPKLLEVGKRLDLTYASESKIMTLDPLTKKQVILSGKLAEKEFGGGPSETAEEAVALLKKNSEAQILLVKTFHVAKTEFTEVLTYPKQRLHGIFFAKDTTNVVAYNQDGTIFCK